MELLIFETIKMYDNCELVYTKLSDNKIAIANTVNQGVYEITVEEVDDGFMLNTEDAVIIKEPIFTESEVLEEEANVFLNTIKGIFEPTTYTESIEMLRDHIKNISSSNVVIPKKQKNDNIITESLLLKKFENQINAYLEFENEFKNNFSIFTESNKLKSGKFYSKNLMVKYLTEANESLQAINHKIEKYTEFKEKMIEIFEDNDDAASFITNKLFIESDMKKSVPKLLVKMKKEFPAFEDLNVATLTREISSYLETHGVPGVQPHLTSGVQTAMRPNFLRPNMGTYSHDDLLQLAEEINSAYGILYKDLTPETMAVLSNIKYKIEYMINTQQISDHLIQEAIAEFNKVFAGNKNYQSYSPNPEASQGFINVAAELREKNNMGSANTVSF